MNTPTINAFETSAQLNAWLEVNHDTQSELWVRIYKKNSGIASVNWDDCVVAAIAWGWIDGQRKSLDDLSFLQRLTPRRSKSNWSKRNCDIAEQLIETGVMQAVGLAHVLSARLDGRWEKAYLGSADMVLPDDFLTALDCNLIAKTAFDTLNRTKRYAIYHQIQTAKREETRRKRIEVIIAKLADSDPKPM